MDESNRQSSADQEGITASDLPEAVREEAGAEHSEPDAPSPPFEESLIEELSALIDDGQTYARAELAFQKTRAKIAGRALGLAAASLVVAIILLHIAFLALAVGLVIALEPLVSIWGAIAIVVGGLFCLVALLGFSAMRYGKVIAAAFASSEDGGGA